MSHYLNVIVRVSLLDLATVIPVSLDYIVIFEELMD